MTEVTVNNSPDGQGGPPSRRLPVFAGLGLLVLVAVGIGLWLFLRDDAPAAVDLEAATASVADDDTTQDDATQDDATQGDATQGDADDGTAEADESATEPADDASAEIADASGLWTVDTSIGEFSFQDSTGSYIGFRVGEELSSIGETEAVGRTPEVSGSVSIDGQTVTAVQIEADMTAITTDQSRRDNRVHSALETSDFPTASFVLVEPIELGMDPGSGDPISATAVGELTIHGITHPVEVAIDGQLVGDTIAIVGSTDIVFADYGVTAPTAPVVVRVDDFGIVEFQLFLTKG